MNQFKNRLLDFIKSESRRIGLTFLGLTILTVALSFQNCAQKFSSECIDCNEWKSVSANATAETEAMKIAFYDEQQSKILEEDPFLFLSQIEETVRFQKPQLFGEEFAALVRFEASFVGDLFEVFSGPANAAPGSSARSESAKLFIQEGRIHAQHLSVLGQHYTISTPVPATDEIVVGVYFGYRTQDMRLVVNGRLVQKDEADYRVVQTEGVVNFSYLEKRLTRALGLKELIVFGRKLSTYELASLSRHIGRVNELATVIFDGEIDPESDVDFVQERIEFKNARTILKANSCFKCHGSWVSYSEYNYLSSGMVASRKPADSPLWTRLKGTTELDKGGKKKDMPLRSNALTENELDVLKQWILTFEGPSL